MHPGIQYEEEEEQSGLGYEAERDDERIRCLDDLMNKQSWDLKTYLKKGQIMVVGNEKTT